MVQQKSTKMKMSLPEIGPACRPCTVLIARSRNEQG